MEENNLESRPQGGNQGTLVFIIILIILAVSAVWFVSQRPSPTPAEVAETNPQPSVSVENSSAQADLAEFAVEGGSFYFEPNEIKVKVGQKVKITLNSVGGMPHDFVIDELNVKSEQVTDDSTVVEFTPDQTGEFEFYCSVGKHREMGMVGKLIVE